MPKLLTSIRDVPFCCSANKAVITKCQCQEQTLPQKPCNDQPWQQCLPSYQKITIHIYVYCCLLPRLQKNIRFDFDDELKVGDVRYKHLTETIIKVQLF